MSPYHTISALVNSMVSGKDPWCGYSAAGRFRPEERGEDDIALNLNAAFLLSVSAGADGDDYTSYLRSFIGHEKLGDVAAFYLHAASAMKVEIESLYGSSGEFRRGLDDMAAFLESKANAVPSPQLVRRVRNFFFPEANFNIADPSADVESLRARRRVVIDSLNDSPLSDPASEMIITSNILLTVPASAETLETADLPASIRDSLRPVMRERQIHWYDHPVQIGVRPEANEIVYGLVKLDEALDFEKSRGNMAAEAKLTCLLSVSVTHRGLHAVSRDYIDHELRGRELRNLRIFVFTESECGALLREAVFPAALRAGLEIEAGALEGVFGADGEYGRHYSFLKAICALWQVFVDVNIRATFKIDLDQVFPQKELLEQSGATAFGHFRSPLWGAAGTDSLGNPVSLGMMAGSLVNESDIHKSLFFPDVPFPHERLAGDALVFYSQLPQALSTEAEMMTRYAPGTDYDGRASCLQRIHVTGGTNGILLESLRRRRPFTPSFFGRAEDQAYLLSALFDGGADGCLRYFHAEGLVMRHDRDAFAAGAVEAARIGKMVGDYIRILLFSHYCADILPWGMERVKEAIDPFTGCFVSFMPVTVVSLRFALKALEMSAADSREGRNSSPPGLPRTAGHGGIGRGFYREAFIRERLAWNCFYDILDSAEILIKKGDGEMMEISRRAGEIMAGCKITPGGC